MILHELMDFEILRVVWWLLLGLPLAALFAVVNAIWLEMQPCSKCLSSGTSPSRPRCFVPRQIA
ncbi:cytochrome bd oxidase small subunit, CydX/CbdX family [Rhizobium sp. CRIBSB]|nr:cytochrome bd oxidase small subunit, CydX/CbdX family [Rhizobium sp. CRIBSB]